MTPIVFLDFDGVLNHELFYRTAKRPFTSVEDQIDPDSVGRLNTLLTATDAKVVVSSTWRKGRTVEELQRILVAKGFTGEVIGKTEDLRSEHCLRGNEIYLWLEQYRDIVGSSEEARYVILDDDSDMLLWQRDHFIQTDPWCGLTPNNVWRATKILQRKA